MTDPDRQAFDDLVKASITMFVIVGDESYFMAQTHKDNPEIGASEVVILTITRKHLPPIQSSPNGHVFAGVMEYEGVAV